MWPTLQFFQKTSVEYLRAVMESFVRFAIYCYVEFETFTIILATKNSDYMNLATSGT